MADNHGGRRKGAGRKPGTTRADLHTTISQVNSDYLKKKKKEGVFKGHVVDEALDKHRESE